MNHFVSRSYPTPFRKAGGCGERIAPWRKVPKTSLSRLYPVLLLITALPAFAQEAPEATPRESTSATMVMVTEPASAQKEPRSDIASSVNGSTEITNTLPPNDIAANAEPSKKDPNKNKIITLNDLLEISNKLHAECESKLASCSPSSMNLKQRLDDTMADQQRLVAENVELKRRLKSLTSEPLSDAHTPVPGAEAPESPPLLDPVAEAQDPVAEAQDIFKHYPCAALWVHKDESGIVTVSGVTHSKRDREQIKLELEKENILGNADAFGVRLIGTNLCIRALPDIPEHAARWAMIFDKRDDAYAESIDDLTVSFQSIPRSARDLLPPDQKSCRFAALALAKAADEKTINPLTASNAEIWAVNGGNIVLCRKESWLSEDTQPDDEPTDDKQSANGWRLRSADVSRKDAILVIDISR